MKKKELLCFPFFFSNSFYAQDTKAKKEASKKETTKKKSGYDYGKDITAKTSEKK